mgnify:CR=1 FL=1
MVIDITTTETQTIQMLKLDAGPVISWVIKVQTVEKEKETHKEIRTILQNLMKLEWLQTKKTKI